MYHKISEFNIPQLPYFTGEKISILQIIDKPIVINKYDIKKVMQDNIPKISLMLSFYFYDTEKQQEVQPEYVTFTRSTVLQSIFPKIPDNGFPLLTIIKKVGGTYCLTDVD